MKTLSARELAPEGTWRASSYSGNGNNCVEVAEPAVTLSHGVGIRDSKIPAGPALAVQPAAFASFVKHVADRGFAS